MKRARREILVLCLAVLVLPFAQHIQAQQARVYRVGVIHEGGPSQAALDGLKDGLKELGLEEGKQYVVEAHDLHGDRSAAAEAARDLERANVDLIYTMATSVTAVVKRSTTKVPIVFAVGEDPVVAGLVENFASPGGRLTGVYNQYAVLTAKRLQILNLILPDLHKVVTFYDPSNPSATAAAKAAKEAARQLRIDLVDRHVMSVEQLRQGITALRNSGRGCLFPHKRRDGNESKSVHH